MEGELSYCSLYGSVNKAARKITPKASIINTYMQYEGKYKIFNVGQISTYPLSTRSNKVKLEDLIKPGDIDKLVIDLPDKICSDIEIIAKAILSARESDRPVVLFTGAHLIKNGLGPLLADLVKRRLVSLVAGNCATAIHDFELALIGQTSENVPDALGKGQFGMAYEFAYINCALSVGNENNLGLGESLGKTICDGGFRNKVFDLAVNNDSPRNFSHPQVSVLAACYENNIPFTIHVGIGTDVIDQHPSFDGKAKGGCSGRDFLIYTNEITKFTDGGVILNIGSAVTGPEVLLKAVSMAANAGSVPNNIITADFDLRDHQPKAMGDESEEGYYFRDQKSIVTRIPQAFNGKGFYIQANQKQTFPLLYKKIVEKS
ncbi:MAG: hypothetical protein JW837_03980 [Sedimentisphaerales bacterium]|nr:hypothetical protein [Sedimentisphaerales bacterium]